MVVQLAVAVFYLLYPGYMVFAVVCMVLLVFYIWFMKKYYHLHG